ncbi:hypothetical protein CC86DRAFT_421063, partial [Ophiobolus disseminans]
LRIYLISIAISRGRTVDEKETSILAVLSGHQAFSKSFLGCFDHLRVGNADRGNVYTHYSYRNPPGTAHVPHLPIGTISVTLYATSSSFVAPQQRPLAPPPLWKDYPLVLSIQLKMDNTGMLDTYNDSRSGGKRERGGGQHIYNIDEKGFLIGVLSKMKRVFSKSAFEEGKLRHIIQDGNRE